MAPSLQSINSCERFCRNNRVSQCHTQANSHWKVYIFLPVRSRGHDPFLAPSSRGTPQTPAVHLAIQELSGLLCGISQISCVNHQLGLGNNSGQTNTEANSSLLLCFTAVGLRLGWDWPLEMSCGGLSITPVMWQSSYGRGAAPTVHHTGNQNKSIC